MNRTDIAVIFFIPAGVCAAFATWFFLCAAAWNSSESSSVSFWFICSPLILLFPAFLVGTKRRKWAILPMWLLPFVSLGIAIGVNVHTFDRKDFGLFVKVLCIPALTQVARWIRGNNEKVLQT
ncbi:MAG: hypothetical protein P4L10_09490 [Acidobacteriaceae bacterium]|nr:hypothetical protein [Acidobacteriaceae bacterium]